MKPPSGGFLIPEKNLLSLLILQNQINMSKVDELKKRYSSVSNSSFNKFVEADTTATKKYLDFMLKTWEDRKTDGPYRTTNSIVHSVNKFHSLLPFIENKDIYSKEYYGNFGNLLQVIDKAEEAKEEKSFNKEEHINVILENERYIFLQPLTHKGSMKYGANTKWCTTTKNNSTIFKNYTKNGLLLYLIDKTECTSGEHKKVAFYHEFNVLALNDNIKLYDMKDKYTNEQYMLSDGWALEDLFEIFTTFRYYFIKVRENKNSKEFVTSFVNNLNKLDFTKFDMHLNKLSESKDSSFIQDAKNKVESFIESINNSKYAIRKTED